MSLRNRLSVALWLFYLVLVGEILFMISPVALYFYSAYGPTLNLLHRSPWTAWLTTFFLPHFSHTTSPLLALQKPAGEFFILIGLALFMVGFVQIYASKLARTGAVVGGLYRLVRHPQYTAFAILGLGTLLMWPRFLVLVVYVSMLFSYSWLARREESLCVERFGDAYSEYLKRTGRFLPRGFERLSANSRHGAESSRLSRWLRYVITLGAVIAMAFVLRDYSLMHLSGFYDDEVAVLSPAVLSGEALEGAYRIALQSPGIASKVAQQSPLLVYVLPESWYLADLPAEPYTSDSEGHETPKDFDRDKLKVLFTRARLYAEEATGVDIVRKAYGREPIVLVHVDLEAAAVVGVTVPPEHVLWGDIPTPMF